MKYEIRRFCIKTSKQIANEKRVKIKSLEDKIKKYETTPEGMDTESSTDYLSAKIEYETFLNLKTNGSILRSKSTLYEQNEKSSKYFLSLEKKNAINNTIKVVIEDEVEFSNPNEISDCIKRFYTSLFKRSSNKSSLDCFNFLESIPTARVSDDFNEILSREISLDELSSALHSSENG